MKFSGSKLRKLREQKKMTAADVAGALKVARTTVTMWEAEESQPNSEKLNALSILFNVPMESFFEKSVNKLANIKQ